MIGYFENKLHDYLSLARSEKSKLIPIDRELNSINRDVFMCDLKGDRGIKKLSLMYRKQQLERERERVLDSVALTIYNIVSSLISSISMNIIMKDTVAISSDDNNFYQISSFISEYSGSDIKKVIQHKFKYSMINYDLKDIENKYSELMRSQSYFFLPLPGLNRFKSAIDIV